jgi:hypothetical protein
VLWAGSLWACLVPVQALAQQVVVTITSPSSGSTLAYSPITVSATVNGFVPGQVIAGVQFKLDGVNLGSEDTVAPYSVPWEATRDAFGSHTLTALARFVIPTGTGALPGLVFTSDPVTVNWAPCATPLTALPGTTVFNNTVRGQMWVTSGTWRGAFSDASTGIYFYTRSGDSFAKGALIDAVAAGKPDVLWNGSELFILVFKSGSLATLYKYRFSSGSFVLFPGFPVNLTLAGLANAIALAQDSTGKLWATYTSGPDVHVIWSTSADHLTWNTTGAVLANNISTLTTEAATLTHFGGNKIGVAWGNQASAEYAFRFHRDGDPETSWSSKEVIDCCNPEGPAADDHLSLRAAPDGRVFAVTKDSVGNGNLHLFIRSTSGSWSPRITVDSDPTSQPTRPNLVLDVQNDHAYVLYHNSTDGQMYAARTPMDSPGFLRCVFLKAGSNVTTTKQNVGSAGLVATASVGAQLVPGVIALGDAAASAQSQAEPASFAAPLSGADAASAVGATAALPPARLKATPPVDFHVIREGRLSSSLAPANDRQWRWLRGQGVNTIVHLDGAMVDFAQFGFESFLWVPLRAGEPPTEEEAERFLRFIQLGENQPAHLSGAAADTRGVMVALARYAIDGWPMEAALAEGRRLRGVGLSLSTPQVQWLLRWAADHAPGSHRLDRER